MLSLHDQLPPESNMLCYLFVDGRYFQKALDNISSEFFGGEKLPVDYGNFAQSYTKVFYYDCLPPA